jgi:hypothetical protein
LGMIDDYASARGLAYVEGKEVEALFKYIRL